MLFSDIVVADFATIFTGVHSSIDSQSNILYTCEQSTSRRLVAGFMNS